MPRSIIPVIGGTADGNSIARPPRDQATFPLQGQDIHYIVRRLRTASGRRREVLALGEIDPAYLARRKPAPAQRLVARRNDMARLRSLCGGEKL